MPRSKRPSIAKYALSQQAIDRLRDHDSTSNDASNNTSDGTNSNAGNDTSDALSGIIPPRPTQIQKSFKGWYVSEGELLRLDRIRDETGLTGTDTVNTALKLMAVYLGLERVE